MEIFKQEDYIRYDFKWYGFGWSKGKYDEAHHAIVTRRWVNSYRTAPIRVSWITTVAWTTSKISSKKWFKIGYSGSIVEPYAHWSWRIGRLIIGGDSPKWLVRYKNAQSQKRWEKEAEAYEAMCIANGWDQQREDTEQYSDRVN